MIDIVLPEMVLFIVGVLYRFFPPAHINDMHGYRTKRSKKNIDNWRLGNHISGTGFIIAAVVSLVIGMLLSINQVPGSRLINIVITILSAVLVVRYTESRIK